MAFFLGKQAQDKRLGIYVHIPFCKSKCEYCDFYSLPGACDGRTTDDYLQALADHIREAGQLSTEHLVDSVYFGGGTPSYFGAENLEKILDELQRSFRIGVDAEISLEANPESLSPMGLRRMLRAGFNRLSIGVQSDDNEILKKIGRPHTFEQARQAMDKARKAGFANISLDLMYGLPGQTLESWKQTVERIIRMRPEHISCYGLKVEPNTPLWTYQDTANLPNDDQQADMYLAACELLKTHGYEHYEISNWAKKGFECKHNLKYWTGGEYIGFGPTAASDFDSKRFTVMRDLKGYCDGIKKRGVILSECDTIPQRERAGEYLMLRLRIAQGINAREYERHFLLPFAPIEEAMQKFQTKGLTEMTHDRWRLTERGWLVSNQIILYLQELQERSTPITKGR